VSEREWLRIEPLPVSSGRLPRVATSSRSATGASRIARWRKLFFIILHRNAPTMQDFFSLPRQQVLELGLPVEI